ncbi:MAG: TIGR01777 family oxidoreductase [Bdellovibrionaceae bacterium]|nr:TIGR01777 family oxidoreductase [Pseudobdellovibrionaceae bacterium]
MKILLTGATGLIGKELGKALVRAGHEVCVVSRDQRKARLQCPFPCEVIEGDLLQGPLPPARLEGVEAVIHLLGDSVAEGRWTSKKKKRLVDSRVLSLRHLRASFRTPVKTLVSASAVGFYGDRGEEELTENAAAGTDFLAQLCVAWEKEAKAFSEDGTRVVCLRLGVVLSHKGGALNEMLTPFLAGVGGSLGGGGQWMSWIHLEDAVGLFLHAFDNVGLKGSFNAVAPQPVRHRDFVKTLAAIVRRPHLMAAPKWALRPLLGEKAQIITDSQKVSSVMIRRTGYDFLFHDLKTALFDLLVPYNRGEQIFVAEQYLPLPPDQLFPFFCEAGNLARLTPPMLDFHVLSMHPVDIQSGTEIEYRLKVHGLPVKWRTRIEDWNPPFHFVDTQLKGPYKLWHHTHQFERLGSGTLMTDTVRYILPGGYLGWLGGHGLVRADVEKIFTYRREAIGEIYGQVPLLGRA